ncbi:FAD-dependent monooxygenase [Streptomyces thermocarboxydus]
MSSPTRHAEIAGGGLAGLTTATALAQRGWSVRLHERGRELREIGAGIFMWENALRVLEEIGAFDEAVHRAERIDSWRLYDERQRRLQDDWMKGGDTRLYTVLRPDLHRALANAATKAGVEIVTGSLVAGANPEGELILESGKVLKADLVVGADGVGSPVRNSVGLNLVVRDLEDGCMRSLIPGCRTTPSTTPWSTGTAGAWASSPSPPIRSTSTPAAPPATSPDARGRSTRSPGPSRSRTCGHLRPHPGRLPLGLVLRRPLPPLGQRARRPRRRRRQRHVAQPRTGRLPGHDQRLRPRPDAGGPDRRARRAARLGGTPASRHGRDPALLPAVRPRRHPLAAPRRRRPLRPGLGGRTVQALAGAGQRRRTPGRRVGPPEPAPGRLTHPYGQGAARLAAPLPPSTTHPHGTKDPLSIMQTAGGNRYGTQPLGCLDGRCGEAVDRPRPLH